MPSARRRSTATVALATAARLVAGAASVALLFAPVAAGADPATTTTTTTTTVVSPKAVPGAPSVRAPVQAQLADALPVDVDFPGGIEWTFSNECGTSNGLPTGGTSDGSPGLAVLDAGTDPSISDAFDCGAMVWVGNTIVADDDGTVDVSGDATATFLTPTPATIGGLRVTDSYRMFTPGDTVRVLVELQNPTGADISTPVSYVSNFGSDAGTVLAGSSSGGGPFTTADRWIVTADDPTAGGDPINTTVLYGPGAVAVTPAAVSTTVFDANTTDGALATFDVTVPAGQTRDLMFFQVVTGGGNGTPNSAAVATAAVWNQPIDPTSPLLAGIPAAATARILNWAIAPAAVPVPAAPVAAPAAAVGVVPTFAG